MNIADQIMRRADRAFAEASGRTLIEDLSPMERKAIEDDMERKARYVRTPAGVRRFKRPIGAIILPRGMGSLDQIRIKDPVFKGFDLVEDRKGNLYDVGKDDSTGKYVALKHNTWDDQVEPQDSLDKALEALNEKLGGGTNSDEEKPAKKAKKPAPKKTPEPQGDAPASDDNVASSDPRKRSAKFKRAADNMDRALDAVDNAKTEDDYRRALVDLEKSTVEMEDYIKSKGSEEDFARSALPKIERAKAKARSQIKRMEAKRKDQAGAGARDKSKAVTRDTPIGTQVRVSDEAHGNAGATGKIVRRNKNGVTIKGKDGTFSAPYDALETTSKADGKRIEAAQGASKDLDLLDRQASGLQKTMDRMEKASTLDELNELDRDFTVQRARQRVKADEIIKNPRTSDEDRKRAQDAKDRVSKLDDDEIALLERKRKELSAPKPKAASKGGPGSPERDAFIESHPKIKDVTDYHKPKLRDMSEKNFEAYVAAVEGGKSPNSIGPIMDRIDAGASWNPVTEKWVGQNSTKRPSSPTPTGDTSAADAADAAVRDRVQKMKDADRSKGRTNPYTSSLTPAQKREVDALTPGEYAKYMNRRDAGDGHHKAVSEARGGQSANTVADDAARNQKNREARESAEQDSRFGNTATFVSANQDLIKKIVSLGRSGKDPYPHISEARARLAEIDKRLSWTDDELGGYHKGKGKAESDERAAQFRKSLQSQRKNYEQAINLMEDLKAKRPKPVGDQHQDMGEIERIGREARERQQAEAGAPSSSDAPKHTSSFLDTPISTSRDVTDEIRNIQDHAKNASHIRREDAARERVRDIDNGIEVLKKLQDDKDGPMTARQRRDADTAIKYAQDVKKRLEARFSGDGETNPVTAPDEAGDRLRELKETQKAIGRIRKITKFQADNYDAATTEEAKERYANGLRQRQATLNEYQAEIEERSKGLDLSDSDRTGLKRAQNALKRAQEDIDHVLGQEERRKASRGGSTATAQQSQSTSSGASEALKSEAGEYRSKARDLSKRIRDALSDTTSHDEAYRDRLRALDAEYTALLPRNRQIQDAHFGSDKATQDELRGVANAAQEMGAERNRLATRLNGVNIALERQQSRRPQAKRPETTPSRPRETSSPAPAQERVKGVDSTVSLAKTQVQKARRARTEKSARDHINTLNSAERDLNRNLERSGDRMPADQRAEVEQVLQEIRAARAKAEQNIPLNQRTHLRPEDLPALRDETRMFGTRGRQDPELTSAEELHEALPSKSTGRYQEYDLDMDALDQMVTDGTAPSVPEMNRAIRAMEADEKRPDGDEHSEALKDLKRARDYIKDRLDRERAEFEAANTSLFGDDLSIPEPTPARPRSAVERAQDALNAYDERARNAPRPDRGMESMRFHQSQRQLNKRADRDLNEALRQVRERNKLEGDVQRAKVQERRDATPKTPVSPEVIKGADAVLIYNKNTQGADWHRVKRVNKTTVTTQGAGGWGGDDLRISHDRVVGVRKSGETILGSTDKPSNEPKDGPFRRGADRLRRAGVEEFTPNQARQVDEMRRDQWEAAQGRVDAGESLSDVLGSTAVRNRRDPMAPPPVSRDEVQRRLAERRAARGATPRPAGQSEDRTNKTAIDIGTFGVRSEAEARQMYANTPRRDIADIPKGGNGHIGNGIWVKRCPVCGQAFKSVGAPGYSATYARHVDGHNTGAAIPGYNTGMMS